MPPGRRLSASSSSMHSPPRYTRIPLRKLSSVHSSSRMRCTKRDESWCASTRLWWSLTHTTLAPSRSFHHRRAACNQEYSSRTPGLHFSWEPLNLTETTAMRYLVPPWNWYRTQPQPSSHASVPT